MYASTILRWPGLWTSLHIWAVDQSPHMGCGPVSTYGLWTSLHIWALLSPTDVVGNKVWLWSDGKLNINQLSGLCSELRNLLECVPLPCCCEFRRHVILQPCAVSYGLTGLVSFGCRQILNMNIDYYPRPGTRFHKQNTFLR